ncbi:MAG: 30S ribosome-binding factor RbfA [Candidatus Cloacimonetes bacterium]|nr:30S ribosome-binding factor RbfA [Candidatus Cloacimonadota bacterium]
MKSYRIPRLQSELKKLFNTALTHSLSDPNLQWVSITDIELSKDLRYAKVFFSHYNNPLPHDKVKENLVKTSGFLKKLIAGAQLMRTIPEISFHYDETEERAEKIDVLLSSIKDDYDDAYDPDIDLDEQLDDDYYDIDEDEEIDDYDSYDDDDEEF